VLYKGQPARPATLYELTLQTFLSLAKERRIRQQAMTRALFEAG
jgi:hypothetical protein